MRNEKKLLKEYEIYFRVLTSDDVRTMPLENVIALSPYIFDGEVNKSAEIVKEVLIRIWTECCEDKCRGVINGIAHYMYDKYSKYDGQEVEIALPGASISIDELYQKMKEAVETIAKVWEDAK